MDLTAAQPTTKPDRNLALEMARVTEVAALAAARWIGRGDKEAADQAAVDAMRVLLGSVHMDGVVVIGEGEKDEAPMLYNGEHIGDGSPPEVDIAVDPLEGTELCAFGLPNAIAPWLAALPGRSGWICAMAFAGEHPVAAGAAYVSGEYAWLGFGATKVAHRSRGAQRALLARRLDEAAARGVRVAVTETGERVPGKPSNSYRNILRAGFAEAYLRANFMSAAR